MADAWRWFTQFPPISRTLAAAAFISSLGVYNGLISAKYFAWAPWKLFTRRGPDPLQLVTAFTNYLITGPKLGIIMDPFWLYKWSHELEVNNSRFSRREDYVWYLLFVGGVIHVLNYCVTMNAFLLNGLELALCYTACQDARGANHGLFFFTIPAQLMPLAMIAMTLLMTGSVQACYLQMIGLVAAHMYDFLSRIFPEFGGGPNLIPTPSWVSWLVSTPRVLQRGYGTAVRSPEESRGGSTGSSTSGPLPDAWRTRGRGHRLGGS